MNSTEYFNSALHDAAENPSVLEWKARWKSALGTARGLRYLQDECHVGCVVHRDMRPSNILVTDADEPVPMVCTG